MESELIWKVMVVDRQEGEEVYVNMPFHTRVCYYIINYTLDIIVSLSFSRFFYVYHAPKLLLSSRISASWLTPCSHLLSVLSLIIRNLLYFVELS